MSVQNQIVKNVYEGNGSTTVFPYTFALNETDGEHVKVYIADESELSTPTDNFTIDTQLRTVTYPRTGAALPEGSKIVIRRELPNEQDTNLENNGAFFAETIEREFDREVMMIQQLAEQVDRAVKTDMSSVTTPDELIAELRAKAQAAVESASAALVSENNARASEQAAAQSETNAESYKDTTYGYMTTTEAYVSQAETSATTATNKATEASASASAAAQSKTAAEAAADTAYDYMIEAGASESIATQKATNAAESATSASASATSAANSAELASTFAHRLPVGTVFQYAGNGESPIGALLCDGSAVSRTMYPDLFEKIGTTYGAGDGSTTFNLPNLSDNRFVEGSTTAGMSKSAGLPNIKGHWGDTNHILLWTNTTGTGAMSNSSSESAYSGSNNSAYRGGIDFDASLYNSIYSDSVTTVQPKSLTLRYFIQAFDGQTPDSALIDITQYAQELATKANRQLSNLDTANLACHVVVDSYYDSTTGDWWREYDDGWLEQGGTISGTGSYGTYQVTLLKPFADDKYLVLTSGVKNHSDAVFSSPATPSIASVLANCGGVGSVTTTSFKTANDIQVWYACGMGASV